MAQSALAYVTPDVLRWARETTGYSVDEAAEKIGMDRFNLRMAEQGEEVLTMNEAEHAAKTYQRPLSTLFFPEPPEEEPVEALFRRLPGSPSLPWSPAMKLLARRVASKQEAITDLYEALEDEQAWPSFATALRNVPLDDLATQVRRRLGVSADQQESLSDKWAVLRYWVDAVEAAGVFVMQSGELPVTAMRGFAAPHRSSPIVVLNTDDDPRSRAYTILHELGHLVLDASGQELPRDAEAWCNEFAGAVMLPRPWLARVFTESEGVTTLARVDATARTVGATPLATAVRLTRSDLLTGAESARVLRDIQARGHQATSRGGNYYLTQISHMGPGFIQLVFQALDRQAVTYPVASALLDGVKPKNFEKLRLKLASRTGVE